ncbi:cellulase family glycosylhydrolase [Seonamhaeicola maritimus]|uniref:cellulase family glycosylhydrolase n=1 Tax=Seonamhaeicola maritimus TaxID=2591822 RepID=UPI002494E136|nr:cellulase family glycosylhydrolase [Seonamhaeicola maritimus]
MKHLKVPLLILLVLSFQDGQAQVTPQQMISNMGRGINIGNALSAPVEGNWAPALTEDYFIDIEAAGFTTARIPIDFFGVRTSGDTSGYSSASGTLGAYSGSTSDYVVSSTYLDRIEQVINWSLNHNLITILDFHGSNLKTEFLYTHSPKSKWAAYYTEPTSAKRAADNDKFRAIWTTIANRFKDYSYNLIFEVVNEPYFWLTDIEMDALNIDVISIIRNSGSKNTDRNIIITGGSKNSYEAPLQISNTVLSSDNNLIATFHYYWPRAFTASSGENDNDFDWGNNTDKLDIDTNFGAVKTWSQNNSIPILLGEFGADNEGGYNYATQTYGSFGGPENASRVAYHEYLAEKAIELGFAFAAWDAGDKSNKTIYKVSDRTWVDDVKNALLGSSLSMESYNFESLKVFPNPVTSKILNLKTSKRITDVAIYNLKGSKIKIKSFKSNLIELPPLQNGMYILKTVFNDGNFTNHKILINQ